MNSFGTEYNPPKSFSIEWLAWKLFGKKTHRVFSMLHISLEGWFYSALQSSYNHSKNGISPFGTYYEFGVGGGRSLAYFLKALNAFCRDYKIDSSEFRIFAFDTFEGLPDSEHVSDVNVAYKKGYFAHDVSEIKRRLISWGIDLEKFNIRFIEGKFEQSLTSSLREELEKFPPSIVNVDVDYYTSCNHVLKWLRPMLQSGSLFYFDDIWGFAGNPNYGEIRSIREFNEEEEGYMTHYPILGMPSRAYIYSKKEYEHI